jgi:hypothetical protein
MQCWPTLVLMAEPWKTGRGVSLQIRSCLLSHCKGPPLLVYCALRPKVIGSSQKPLTHAVLYGWIKGLI